MIRALESSQSIQIQFPVKTWTVTNITIEKVKRLNIKDK